MNDDTQPDSNPYRIADPVVDLAQGRAMVVLDAPEQNAAEWSNENNYDLLENYANSRFDPDPDEYVVECVYVSDIRNEPSKSYTFPVSRVKLIEAHHADDGQRLAERVVVDLLERLFHSAATDGQTFPNEIAALARRAGVDAESIDLAQELADVEQTIAGGAE